MAPLGLDPVRFYGAGMILCAVGVLINVALSAKRGNSALMLGGAFAAFGFVLYSLQQKAGPAQLWFAGGLVVVFLVADFVLRANSEPAASQRR